MSPKNNPLLYLLLCSLFWVTTACTVPEQATTPLASDTSPDASVTSPTETVDRPVESDASGSPSPSADDVDDLKSVPVTIENPSRQDTSTTTLPTPSNGKLSDSPTLSEEVEAKLITAIANDTGQSEDALTIQSVTQMTWPNGCLGLATPDEFCTMALIEGWQISVTDGQDVITYRSNATGTVVRRDR